MIEVILTGNRWTWRMICAAGRVLASTAETFDTDFAAFAAAKDYRTRFWAACSEIDHRMGACI
ncbi:hypothetical protein [Sphingomonas sp.]|uniref:hypothetical protein n=1 Tax=Sphingomonas sp. TaxID=28214 RepID=UPI00307EF05A